jgi:hypothetical protein
MTMTIETVRARFAGDDASYVFRYPFRVDDSTSLRVIRVTDSTGATEDLTISTGYTIDGIGDPTGGDVTLALAERPLASGTTLVLLRQSPATQPSDYLSSGRVNPETMELSLDRVTQQTQELADLVDRSLQLREGDVDGTGAYDANGNRITNLGAAVEQTDAVTLAYFTMPVYTTQAAADAAMGTGALALYKMCIVNISGLPDQVQMVVYKADGVTKALATMAVGPVV